MKKKSKKILFIIVSMLLILSGCNKNENKEKEKTNNDKPVVAEKKLKIIDEESNTRPYAVMINNIAVARKYQSGLDDAYIVYEMIVEGGITRLLALYKDANVDRIGSVRSSRHYYLDYALENDAIYVHFGWSPQAQSDIKTLGINNINGIYDDSAFVRESKLPVSWEHNAFTSTKKITAVAKNKGYRMTSDKDTLLNYSVDEISLENEEEKQVANKVDIKYSNSVITNYEYNEKEKVYYRSVNNVEHTDYVTKKQYTAKNIIIAYIDNSYISNDDKGRQNIDNIGSGIGYYITDGYANPITWSKSGRKEQTVYKKKNGEEIKVNDGNTYIQNAPSNSATIS